MRSCAPQGAPPGGGTWWLSSEKEARSFHIWKTRGLRPKALSAPEWPWPQGAPTSPLGRAVGSALAVPYRAASWPRATCRREPPQTGRAVPLAVTAESPARLPLERRGPWGRGGLARVTQLSHAPGRWRGGGAALAPCFLSRNDGSASGPARQHAGSASGQRPYDAEGAPGGGDTPRRGRGWPRPRW